MKKIKKLIFLLAVIAVAFVCIVIINFVKLDVSYYDIKNVKLPEDFNGYKIVQISDWHGRKPDERVINKIREENPDIIVITGDFVDRFFTDTKNAGKMISQIKDIAPVYYVSGNHEAQNNNYDDFKQYLYSENITVLDNKSVMITKGSGKIRLAGVDDPFFPEIEEKTTEYFNDVSKIINDEIEAAVTSADQQIDSDVKDILAKHNITEKDQE